MRFEDFVLRMGVSAVSEGRFLDITAKVESGNIRQSIDDVWSARKEKAPAISMERHVCQECRESQYRNLVCHTKDHHDMDNRPSFPFQRWDDKFVMSVHPHLNSVHLKVKPFEREICKKSLTHKKSLEAGKH